MNDQVNLTDLEYNELESFVTETLGQPKFRAKQIFGWIHGGPAKDGGIRMGAESFEDMSNLPKSLCEAGRMRHACAACGSARTGFQAGRHAQVLVWA